MLTIKGPALFLAQFAGDAALFKSWQSIIRSTGKAFDDFAGSGTDRAANRRMSGLD